MVTIDIESIQQILQNKITFGHTKRLSKKNKVWVSYSRYSIIFFSDLHIGDILLR